MSRNLTPEEKLKKYFYKIDYFTKSHLEKYGIQTKDLYENGAVYYMNGNDGTLFDVECNNRLCEFMTFYKEGEQAGASKVCLYSDGSITGYFYKEKDDYFGDSIEEFKEEAYFTENEFLELATFLYYGADEKDIFDDKFWNIDSVFNFNDELDNAKEEVESMTRLNNYQKEREM